MVEKLWGGRFSKKTDLSVEEFAKSIQYDYKLAKFDLLGSALHVEILKESGFLSSFEANRLHLGLQSVYRQFDKGEFRINNKYEDIHTYIHYQLQKIVGDLALKLHTARSRNDQVVFATKCYCKVAARDLLRDIIGLKKSIISLAQRHRDIIIPGFTHMQHAQPVYLKDYLKMYVEMLERDKSRLAYVANNINITLGAGALAGTPINYAKYASGASKILKKYKEFSEFNIKATINSLDSVSDRDFVIELLNILSIIGIHLSRFAEDLIIWSTKEFNFVDIDESFCTGSSLMPHKKNPDVLELIRGYSGRLTGNLVSVLIMMKGLPFTYNRDMQLDKEPLFDSFEKASQEIRVLNGLIRTLRFNSAQIKEYLKDESLYATDLVYYLVNKGVPFKKAHTIIGRLVKYSVDNSVLIKDMPERLIKKFSEKLAKDEIIRLFDPVVSVRSKRSIKRARV